MTTDTRNRPPRAERFDPATFEGKWRARWAADEAVRRPGRRPAAEALRADDVPVPVRRPAHRPLVCGGAGRTSWPRFTRMQRLQRHVPDGLRLVRAAGGERGDRRAASTRATGRRRTSSACAAQFQLDGRDVRLGARGRSPRPGVLPLDAVARSCSSTSAGLAYKQMAAVDWCPKDQVVLASEQVEGATAAAALRHAGRQARPRAVVLPHHALRRRAARLQRDRLAGADPADADATGSAAREGAELDFPVEAGGGRADPRLHDPPGHGLRRHVHGARAGAPAGRRTHDAGAARPMSTRTSTPRGARRRSSA